MLTNNELLELYRMEKRDLDDPLYGPPFPSFREWKQQYVVEYRQTHITVSVDLADQMMEDVLTEADQWLVDATNEEVMKMDENTTVVESTPVEPVVRRAYSDLTDEERAQLRAEIDAGQPKARKMPKAIDYPLPSLKRGRKPNPNKVVKAAATPRGDSKASKAREYFAANFGSKARKDIVAYFVSDLGLTANGAATYYQKFKAADKSV